MKHFFIVFLIATVTNAQNYPSTNSTGSIRWFHHPQDSVKFQNCFYQIISNSAGVTWQQAKEDCEYRDGHLVVIINRAQYEFVKELVNGVKVGSMYKSFWIGLVRESPKRFMWVTGRAPVYKAWLPNEPNNTHGVENCVAVMSTKVGYGWNDVSGESKLNYYVCQWDE
jgi:hypothetical protein